MGAAASVLDQLTPEQQEEFQKAKAELEAEVDGVKKTPEEVEAALKEKFKDWIKKPKKLIISGAPASGKGTQCEWIRYKFIKFDLSIVIQYY